MKSKKICAAVIAAVPVVVAAAACTALYTQSAAAEDLARLDLSAEWAPTWSNKAETVGNVTLQQGMKIAIEEPEELSNLSAATFSDSLAFQGKAPLKVTYINSDFKGKNADNITIEGYAGDKIFDSTTGSFTFYVDADITARTADNTAIWNDNGDATYTYYSPITVKDYSGEPKLSGELNIILKSVEKKQTESSNSSEISTSSNSSESSTPNSSTASSSSSGGSNKVESAYDNDTATDDDNDTNDYADAAAENPDTGIILVIAPVTLAAGAVVAAVCEKKK